VVDVMDMLVPTMNAPALSERGGAAGMAFAD
jgi:hypothetical protein